MSLLPLRFTLLLLCAINKTHSLPTYSLAYLLVAKCGVIHKTPVVIIPDMVATCSFSSRSCQRYQVARRGKPPAPDSCPLSPAGTYSMQWAAVSTQQGWIRVPPQK